MRKLQLFAVLSTFWLLPSVVHAQLDHMTCFKVKDAQKFAATADLVAESAPYDAGTCSIKGKAALFCIPSDKNLSDYTVDKLPATPLAIPGTTPLPNMICYKVKCATPAPPDTAVADQFGLRTLTKLKTSLVCSPAFRHTAPTCQLPDPPQCTLNDPCTDGVCSTTRASCAQQADCPLGTQEECCCNGVCV